MRRLTKADLLIFAVVLIWGSVFSVIKYTLQEIGPLAFATARFLGASILLLALVYLMEGKPIIKREDWPRVAVVGLSGIGIYQICFTLGLNYTTASNSSLIIATSPVFAALFARLLGEEAITPRQIVGILLSLVGVTIIVRAGSEGLAFTWENLRGDALTLMAAVFNAFSAVIAKRPLERYSSLRVTTVSMIFGTLFLLLFGWRPLLTYPWAHLSLQGWLGLGYAVLLAGVIAYVLWFHAIGELGATRTLVYGSLIPIVAVSVAVLTLGEQFTALHALGALIVFVGIALARLAPPRTIPRERRAETLIKGSGDGDRG
jgi:drug/metabolite transporter (DMT)-like permease